MILQVQLYDDTKDFERNKAEGPYGAYVDNDIAYNNIGEPLYDFFGVPVYSPFGIGAGPLPTPRFIHAALNKGFDIVTLKSVRTDTFPLNPYPQVRPVQIDGDLDLRKMIVRVAEEYDECLAVANSFGIPSVTPKIWQAAMKESFSLVTRGQALLAAFQGTARGMGRDEFVADHVKGVGLIREAGANIIEINLSCPNEGEEMLACFDTEITARIVLAVREAYPDIKLIIKLAYFTDKKQLSNLVKVVGGLIDGISAINTIPMNVKDKNDDDVFPGRPKAGISGAPIKWAGIEMTHELARLRAEFGLTYKVIGMGGVLSYADFHDYRKAGADYVMSVTGAMWQPSLAADIKKLLSL